MPEPLTGYILECFSAFAYVSSEFHNWYNDQYDLAQQLGAHNWDGAANAVMNMRVHTWNISQRLLYGSDAVARSLYNALHWIDDNWPADGDEYELTMDKIIETMMGAKFYQIEQFTGLVDAYRTTVWNEPFDVHFYETLVGMFSK